MIPKFLNAINPIDMFNANQMQKLKSYYENNGMLNTAGHIFKDYFSGAQTNYGSKLPKTTSESYAKRARIGAATALGGYALSQTAFEGTAIDSVADFVAGIGIHGTIGSGLYSKNKKYGLAYFGWAGLNSLRSGGDHFGPF